MAHEINIINITIQNKLAAGERDINVFHHASRSAHIISCNSSVTLPLRNPGEGDYLHVSVVRGPGYLWLDCVIGLPLTLDFYFTSEGEFAVTHTADTNRIFLKIPSGPPTWELKISRPGGSLSIAPLTAANGDNIVTIRDDDAEEERR